MDKKKCDHNFSVFRDKDLIGTDFMSFYCRKCLMFKKEKINYAS